jgi:hypothetical protein
VVDTNLQAMEEVSLPQVMVRERAVKRHMHAVCRKFALCLLVVQFICGPGSFSSQGFPQIRGVGIAVMNFCIVFLQRLSLTTGTHAAIRLVVHLVNLLRIYSPVHIRLPHLVYDGHAVS